jgi:hypothetical protein
MLKEGYSVEIANSFDILGPALAGNLQDAKSSLFRDVTRGYTVSRKNALNPYTHNFFHEEIQRRLNSGNACHHSVQNLLSSRMLSEKRKN